MEIYCSKWYIACVVAYLSVLPQDSVALLIRVRLKVVETEGESHSQKGQKRPILAFKIAIKY